MYGIAHRLLAEEDIPFDVLLPLIDETSAKVHMLTPREAQTGPAIRGDKDVMQSHLQMLAEEKDLKAFAAISGYRLVYENGDANSLFSLTFVCNKFTEQDFPDKEEIAEKRWFDFDEIDGLKKTVYATAIWDAYKKYLDSGEFQQVVL
jgi:hypothetical protein